jgi:hypothetical protein
MTITHECELSSPSDCYGAAITSVFENETGLWAGNDEYYSQVNYCPVCGYKAKNQIDPKIRAARKALGEKE